MSTFPNTEGYRALPALAASELVAPADKLCQFSPILLSGGMTKHAVHNLHPQRSDEALPQVSLTETTGVFFRRIAADLMDVGTRAVPATVSTGRSAASCLLSTGRLSRSSTSRVRDFVASDNTGARTVRSLPPFHRSCVSRPAN